MGRNANLILLDGDGRILDCLRRVDMEMNPRRQVLPGLFYRLPPAPEKADPLTMEPEDLIARLDQANPEKQVDQWLLETFFGLSPLVCRELAFQGCGSTDQRLLFLRDEERIRLIDVFFCWQKAIKENRFTPFLLKQENRPLDFSYFPISQYGPSVTGEVFDSFSALLDTFYEARDRQERIRQKGHDLLRAASTARDRVARKLAIQKKELAETRNENSCDLRELITANLYRMERGDHLLQAENYYQEGAPTVEIPLDPLLTPQQNAAKYFRQYNKAKTAEHYLHEQMEKGRQELDYLDSILDELSRAELEQDFQDARAELQAGGYLKNQRRGRRDIKHAPSKPREFHSSSGLRILVGRSNSQNDRLTREASKWDIWFHTQKIHGSHVILCTEGSSPDPQSMTEAAVLAAYFSQSRGGSQVPVDYTPVKNVKKPAGARPGMVVYTPYQTAYVTPDESLVQSLSADKP